MAKTRPSAIEIRDRDRFDNGASLTRHAAQHAPRQPFAIVVASAESQAIWPSLLPFCLSNRP